MSNRKKNLVAGAFYLPLSPIVKFLNSSNYGNEFEIPSNWIEPPIGTCHPDKS